MKKGFTDFAATILVPDFPGQTAPWYAEKYLEEKGKDSSDAKNPLMSLANTLDKLVREGRENRVRRERIDGRYLFFPVLTSGQKNSRTIVVQISLSAQELGEIDNLIAVDKFKNRDEAINWLLVEGIKANRVYLHKVADTRNQIETLKKNLEIPK